MEKLSDAEFKEITAAREEVDAAQAKLDAVEKKIKRAHGQPPNTGFTTSSCIQGSTEVELKGEYALITHESHYVCGTD
ncbi:MAG TPA: hypothetical protein VFA85_13970 [Terriglobales bacterium]|nr:hypothetical protein [Terriglobales bacterium]